MNIKIFCTYLIIILTFNFVSVCLKKEKKGTFYSKFDYLYIKCSEMLHLQN